MQKRQYCNISYRFGFALLEYTVHTVSNAQESIPYFKISTALPEESSSLSAFSSAGIFSFSPPMT